jgi:hypothetical protein
VNLLRAENCLGTSSSHSTNISTLTKIYQIYTTSFPHSSLLLKISPLNLPNAFNMALSPLKINGPYALLPIPRNPHMHNP